MIIPFDTSKNPLDASGLVTRNRWYKLRVMRASQGATIAWDSPRDSIGAFSGATYEYPRSRLGIWVTGVVVLEWTDDPADKLPPISVAGVNLDGANSTIVVGPDTQGAPPTGKPVLIAGSDGALVRVPSVIANGQGPAASLFPLAIGGFDGAFIRALLTDTLGEVLRSGQGAATYFARGTITLPVAAGPAAAFAFPVGSLGLTARLRRLRLRNLTGLQTAAGNRQLGISGLGNASVKTAGLAQSTALDALNMGGPDQNIGALLTETVWTTAPTQIPNSDAGSESVAIPAAAPAVPVVLADWDWNTRDHKAPTIRGQAGTKVGFVLWDYTGGAGSAGLVEVTVWWTEGV